MLWLFDTNFKAFTTIDIYDSLIWTIRYSTYGDFELCIPLTKESLATFKHNYYIWLPGYDKTMVIEDIQLITDIESGPKLIITGRSLESILTRRIVWKQTILHGNLQNAVGRLLNENIISPEDPSRKIDNFIFEASTDPAITSLSIDTQFTGTELYSAINKICEKEGIGFKIILRDDMFVFSLYAGTDRSYNQTVVPYVIFSPEFENIENTSLLDSNRDLKTIILVAGEGEGHDRRTAVVESEHGAGQGLQRREHFTDAREISSQTEDGEMEEEEYFEHLKEKGREKLKENDTITVFEGESDPKQVFKFGRDYFMGDIIQFENEYGIKACVRVTELIHSRDLEGLNIYPTFSIIE